MKKYLCVLLVMVLLAVMFPFSALAAEQLPGVDTNPSQANSSSDSVQGDVSVSQVLSSSSAAVVSSAPAPESNASSVSNALPESLPASSETSLPPNTSLPEASIPPESTVNSVPSSSEDSSEASSVEITDEASLSSGEYGVFLETESLEIVVGETRAIPYRVSTPQGELWNIQFISSDPGVATVDGAGMVTGISAGTSSIMLQVDTSVLATITINVADEEFLGIAASGGVSNKINEILALFPSGSYFSVNGGQCGHADSVACNTGNCKLFNVVSARYPAFKGHFSSDASTCLSFARFAYYYLFGYEFTVAKAPSHSTQVSLANAKPGDFVRVNGGAHSAIYLGKTATHVYLLDSNGADANGRWTATKTNRVTANSKYPINSYTWEIWHANNYGTVDTIADRDVTPPVISNIQITNVTSNGYNISCTATDNVGVTKVMFPTWVQGATQPLWKEGTKSGNTYSFRVNRSDHANKLGTYITHIYAYDAVGNTGFAAANEVWLGDVMTIDSLPATDVSSKGFTVNFRVKSNYAGVGLVSFHISSWENSKQVTKYGVANGSTYSCRVNTSEFDGATGKYSVTVNAEDTTGVLVGLVPMGFPYVTVPEPDKTAPVISNVKVSDTSSAGYTVSCTITDNSEVSDVMFLAWPSSSGIASAVQGFTVPNQTNYSWRVNISDYDDQYGAYQSKIEATDSSGNKATVNVNTVQISPPTPPPSSSSVAPPSSSAPPPSSSSPQPPVSSGGWKDYGGRWCYQYGDGSWAYGWAQIDGAWYYFDNGGYMQTGWLWDGASWFYLQDSGAMATGSVNIGGKTHSFDGSGRWLGEGGSGGGTAGWKAYGNRWCYQYANGGWAYGWAMVDGTWYLFDGGGYMLTGWQNQGGTWYYLHGSGAMATGWLYDGSAWYYMAGSGQMQTGWLWDGASWYFLNGSGQMQTGWLWDGASWFYLHGGGQMATGTVTVDGAAQNFAANGVWLGAA